MNNAKVDIPMSESESQPQQTFILYTTPNGDVKP